MAMDVDSDPEPIHSRPSLKRKKPSALLSSDESSSEREQKTKKPSPVKKAAIGGASSSKPKPRASLSSVTASVKKNGKRKPYLDGDYEDDSKEEYEGAAFNDDEEKDEKYDDSKFVKARDAWKHKPPAKKAGPAENVAESKPQANGKGKGKVKDEEYEVEDKKDKKDSKKSFE
jgi:replication factor C subunit 1